MKYYSEDVVRDIMSDVEDATTAYFWGERKNYPDIEDEERFPYIELPDKHGALKDFNDIVKIFDGVIRDVDDETNRLLADLLVQIQFAHTIVKEN